MSGALGGAAKPADGKPPLIALIGATAVGKTELSLRLCELFGAEIVSADSRQIYCGMDIGTAKPTAAEQARAPHHLIDIRRPDEVLTLAEYQRLATAVIDDIRARGGLPLLVGGSVLYVRAVVEGLRIPEVAPNPVLRQELEELLVREGPGALFALLQEKDAATAAVIDANNPRRLIRALEIAITTGRSKTELEGMDPPPYDVLKIGLNRSREHLHERIDRRVDEMIVQGLVEETRTLLDAGYADSLPAMTSLGYKEIAAYLRGELTLEEAAQRIEVETHRYLRHQMTWLRKMDGIAWVDMDAQGGAEKAQHLVAEFLGRM